MNYFVKLATMGAVSAGPGLAAAVHQLIASQPAAAPKPAAAPWWQSLTDQAGQWWQNPAVRYGLYGALGGAGLGALGSLLGGQDKDEYGRPRRRNNFLRNLLLGGLLGGGLGAAGGHYLLSPGEKPPPAPPGNQGTGGQKPAPGGAGPAAPPTAAAAGTGLNWSGGARWAGGAAATQEGVYRSGRGLHAMLKAKGQPTNWNWMTGRPTINVSARDLVSHTNSWGDMLYKPTTNLISANPHVKDWNDPALVQRLRQIGAKGSLVPKAIPVGPSTYAPFSRSGLAGRSILPILAGTYGLMSGE